jgi:cell wall-associated NlpC family hydrolase
MRQKTAEQVRHAFFNSILGKPWVANAKGPDAYDCYHLTQYIQRTLYNREMPDVQVPNEPSWGQIIEMIETHPERQRWQEVPNSMFNMVKAKDGALVAMAASQRAAHIGVWLAPEQLVVHTDKPDGVVFQDLQTLKVCGWQRIRFYEPVE